MFGIFQTFIIFRPIIYLEAIIMNSQPRTLTDAELDQFESKYVEPWKFFMVIGNVYDREAFLKAMKEAGEIEDYSENMIVLFNRIKK